MRVGDLKVGDVYKTTQDNHWYIDEVTELHKSSEYFGTIKVLKSSNDDVKVGDTFPITSITLEQMELLPLYNSPLYKAMSEGETND